MASNSESKFTGLKLSISNETAVSCISHVPKPRPDSAECKPLIIFIHGTTCTAYHFDATPRLTASIMADAMSIPVVAINRPGYLDSTPLSIPEGSSFHQEHGRFYHESLLPKLWEMFGKPNDCTALVVVAHSIGSMGVIVAAGLHAQDLHPTYPLAGIAYSGLGIRHTTSFVPLPADQAGQLKWKREMMCGKPELALAPSEALDCVDIQDHPVVEREREDLLNGAWDKYRHKFSDEINIPIMFGQAEHDFFWEGSTQQVEEVKNSFPNCPRFEGGIVAGAPHAIEWSHCSHGWYARCFGFALEVTAAYGMAAR